MDVQGTKRRRNVAENFKRLSKAHRVRTLQTTDRKTDRRILRHIAKNRIFNLHDQ